MVVFNWVAWLLIDFTRSVRRIFIRCSVSKSSDGGMLFCVVQNGVLIGKGALSNLMASSFFLVVSMALLIRFSAFRVKFCMFFRDDSLGGRA